MALSRYLDRSFVYHREAVSRCNRLSEELWLSAVIISHISWLLVRQPLPDQPYELPLQALKILRGIGGVFTRESVFLRQLGYNSFTYDTLPYTADINDLSLAAQENMKSIEEDFKDLFEGFDTSSLTAGDLDIYIEAKDYVLHQYRAFYSGESVGTLRRFVVTMVARIQPAYHGLLEKHDPLAMAIMARMMIILRVLGYAWWVNGQGEYEVVERDIHGILGLMPKHLRWAMDWPCRVLNGDIILNVDR
jgi:hypothetical protein